MRLRLVWLLVVVALGGGCDKNPRRDEALGRAKLARARGDYVAEALALGEACSFAPDDHKLCKRANDALVVAHASTQQAARTACTDVEPTLASVDRCLVAVAQIRKLAPEDPEAARLAEIASRQHLARCLADSPSWQSSLDAAIELVRCQDARAAQIALPAYTQQILTARADAREQLLRLAAQPAFADRLGARSELSAAAVCLSPVPDAVERARVGRGVFVDRLRAAIDLRATTTTPLPDLCTAAAAPLAPRAACGSPRPSAPQLTIIADISVLPVEHAAHDTQDSTDYVAGVIRYDNPDYQPAVNDERNARAAKDSAESQLRHDESDCRSDESNWRSQNSCNDCPAKSERDRSCNAVQASERLLRERQSDWDRARQHLSSTPAIAEKDDVRTAYYTVRHHSWRAGWRAQLRSDGSSTKAGGEAVATDRETAGAPVAGVASDPMTEPGNRWFIAPIRDQVAAKLTELAARALERRAGDLATSCPEPLQWTPDWLDCWARVRFWGGAAPDPGDLLRLAGETKDREHGKLWDPLRCLR